MGREIEIHDVDLAWTRNVFTGTVEGLDQWVNGADQLPANATESRTRDRPERDAGETEPKWNVNGG